MGGVLDGVTVVDLSDGIAGAMATMLLADNGATVTDVEPPGGRSFAPYSGRSVWNRGKRSAVLDRGSPKDRNTIRALIGAADVVVDNRTGDDEDLWEAAPPTVIRASITGYGRGVGRHAGRPAVDALVAARMGLHWDQRGAYGGAPAFIAGVEGAGFGPPPTFPPVPEGAEQTGHRDGPIFLGLPFPSIGAALLLTTAISAALLAREFTGRGQTVETSLLQGGLLCTVPTWQRVPDPLVDGYRLAYFDRRHPKGFFQCRDRKWVHHWAPIDHAFVQAAAGGDELRIPTDAELTEAQDRSAETGEALRTSAYDRQLAYELRCHPVTAAAFARFPSADWVDLFARAGRPCQPVRTPEEGLYDPWSLAEGCVAEVDDVVEGPIRQVGLVYRLSDAPGRVGGSIHSPKRVGGGAPAPGAHTAEVRAEAARSMDGSMPRSRAAPRARRYALEGIGVIDLGMAMAGPYGTQTLGDLGATVIKIHNPGERHAPVSSPTIGCHRGKRSIALDLKDRRGNEVLRRLAARADVVHHNLRTGVAERLGADYATLREVNPGLIYCHTRGFESTGPRVGLPGNDQMGQALAGSWHEMGAMYAGMPPSWHPAALGDFGNGVASAIAVIQALYHRERTGSGQMVDTSIINVGLLYNSSTFARRDGTGPDRARLDAGQHGFGALYRLYPTSDGWLCLGATTDDEWHALVTATDAPGLRDARFATAGLRDRNDAELARIIGDLLSAEPTSAWVRCLDTAGVPCEASVPDLIRDIWDDPDLIGQGRIVGYPHPTLGHVDQVGHLVDLSDTPGFIRGVAPLVGQHSRQILAELGYRKGDIDGLISAGVVWPSEA